MSGFFWGAGEIPQSGGTEWSGLLETHHGGTGEETAQLSSPEGRALLETSSPTPHAPC